MKPEIVKPDRPNKPINTYRQRTGRWGERVAEEYLLGRGLRLLARNVRTSYGEIDLVFEEGDQVVLVEVKTRSNRNLGQPEDAITPKKRMHLLQSAEAYMQSQPDSILNWRIDVVSILGKIGDENPEIVWFENALA
jgi:putative endonuclease